MNAPQPTTPAPPARGRSYLFTAGLVVALVAAAGGYYLYVAARSAAPPPVDEFAGLKPFFTHLGDSLTLAPEYADADRDLVADPPTDPAKFRPVEEIGFSVVGTDDAERAKVEQAEWAGFVAALAAATGKKVTYRSDATGPQAQMDALKGGRLHVTAFNTGAVPAAVNTAGFVPLFAPADAAGNFSYRMEILVRADSPIRTPDELKGKTVGFVTLSSNSGAKAPMFVLKDKFGMLPGRDYTFTFTGDHFISLTDLTTETKLDAACVASDMKDRALAAGKVKADQFRVIFASDPFPQLCFGVAHDLPPDVRAKVEAAFRDFKLSGKAGKVRFAAVNYEKDWKFVREIDAALGRFAE